MGSWVVDLSLSVYIFLELSRIVYLLSLLDNKWHDKSFVTSLNLNPKPKCIWLSFGDDFLAYAEKAKEHGISVFIMVHSVKEALNAQKQKADVIILQGSDAGGHGKNYASVISLVPEVRDALDGSGIPIIAAGGIVDGRGLAAALMLGADGVAMGTRMAATHECQSSEQIKQRYVVEKDGGLTTVATHIFDYLSPFDWGSDVIGRALGNNITVQKFRNFLYDRKFSPSVEDKQWYRDNKDNIDIRPIWSGTGCGLIKSIIPAEQVISDTIAEAISTMKSKQLSIVPTK